jgi:hypothetical protein
LAAIRRASPLLVEWRDAESHSFLVVDYPNLLCREVEFFIEFSNNREQPRRQFFGHSRPIVLSQLLADSFFGLTPIKPFA